MGLSAHEISLPCRVSALDLARERTDASAGDVCGVRGKEGPPSWRDGVGAWPGRAPMRSEASGYDLCGVVSSARPPCLTGPMRGEHPLDGSN